MNRGEAGVRREWVRRHGPILAVYVLATWLTNADFMGDTVDYVASIVAMTQGHDHNVWEFAHLLWRPLGWVVASVFTPLSRLSVGGSPYANVTRELLTISWLAGLLAVVVTHALALSVAKRRWAASVVTIAFVFSYGFLNYAQSGTPYVPGLSLLLLGVYILVKDGDEVKNAVRSGVLAGSALAGAVLLWVTYGLAVPAAVLAPLLIFGVDRSRLRLVLLASLACAGLVSLAYVAVLAHLGIYDLGKLRAWMAASAEAAYLPRGGVPRMIFSLARSFFDMGNDGVVFKRFLRHDPFNPVGVSDLILLSIGKLALFYVFVGAVVANLVRTSEGRRVLALLVVSLLPVMALALFLEGGAADRYLPLYPFIFLGLAHALSEGSALRLTNMTALGFCAGAIVINGCVLATPVVVRQEERAAARIQELQPLLKPESVVVAVNLRDELVNFSRSFPLNPINLDTDHPLRVGSLVVPGSVHVSRWREGFASTVLRAWKGNGDVWMSKRVLSMRPQPEWGWVESDDPRVSWTDVYEFFSRLEMGGSLGGEDGFVLLKPSRDNQELLRNLAARRGGSSKLSNPATEAGRESVDDCWNLQAGDGYLPTVGCDAEHVTQYEEAVLIGRRGGLDTRVVRRRHRHFVNLETAPMRLVDEFVIVSITCREVCLRDPLDHIPATGSHPFMKAVKPRPIHEVLHLGEGDVTQKSLERHAVSELTVGEQSPPASLFRFAEKVEQA